MSARHMDVVMTDKMDIIDAVTAAKILSKNGMPISPDTLREGLISPTEWPWGKTVISHIDQHIIHTYVYKADLMRWIQERKMT